jgi:peptidoglycan/LPS O-acetylase OafA/YrhL
MIFFPVWVATIQTGNTAILYSFFPLHFSTKTGDVTSTIYFPYSITAMFAVASATVAILEIRRFDNRLLQIKMGALNSLFIAATLGSAVFFAIKLIKINSTSGEYGLALFMPVVAMLCNAVANRFIRKDEKTVRDSDRLR